MKNISSKAPGVALTLIVAIMSYLVSSIHPSFDLLAIAMIFGMMVSNLLGDRESFVPGINASLGFFLPLGIALYGFQLNLGGTAREYWPAAAGVVCLSFFSAYMVSKAFGLHGKLSLLLAAGMSICGASAIAIIAPLVDAEKEDTSISLISVLTVGLGGMLAYQFIPDMLGISERGLAVLAGASLPMMGQVKVVASEMSKDGSAVAVGIKVFRVAFVAPAALWAVYAYGGRKGLRLPWFMWMFFALALAANIVPQLSGLRDPAGRMAAMFLAVGLSSIGLSIETESISQKGATPLLAAGLSWGIVFLILYMALNFFNA